MEALTTIVEQQRQFFHDGKTKNPKFRKEQLKTFLKTLKENEQLLIDAAWKDLHKSEFETYATELGLVYGEIEYAIRKVQKWAKPKNVITNLPNLPGSSFIKPEPLGNCLVIGAWNYPYLLTLGPVIGAMAAGNTVLLKPSEIAPSCSAALAKILNAAFDPGYFYVLEGGIAETQALLKHKFDTIFFTGSTRVGKIIYKAAAENLTPVTLELGGKSPCIVDQDAAIKVAARRIAWGKFINAGQVCIAPDYLLVHKNVKDLLIEKIKEYLIQFYGEDPQQSPDYVRIGSRPNFEKLKSLIDPAKVYYGGQSDEKDLYIAPTILNNVSWEDKVMQEEVFGPVLPVLVFDDFMETIALLKKLPKPLALYYFGHNKGKQNLILNELSFGGGTINDVVMHISNPGLPFGGVGNSGFGSYHGKKGFETFSHHKSIMKRADWIDLPLKYPPYSTGKLNVIKKLL
ncbi:MAG: aldehyde dehydrogenase [Bacteroidales bacterium]|nr:aldehyde dehydrogenase [Bacteroidales bacterium]